jgi:hypothetical protein
MSNQPSAPTAWAMTNPAKAHNDAQGGNPNRPTPHPQTTTLLTPPFAKGGPGGIHPNKTGNSKEPS